MATPFAAHAARVNRAVADKLTDKVLTFGGVDVSVCFTESLFEAEPNAVKPHQGTLWQAQAPWDDFGATPPRKGDVVSVDGVDYTVAAAPKVDVSGWATYRLNRGS